MKNNNKFRLDVWGFITLAMIALYLLFMIYPMGYLIRQSVWNPETGAFTWENFSKFFSKSYYFDTLFNSFKVSIAATVLSLVIGTPLAYLFSIYKIRGKSILSIMIVVASMSAHYRIFREAWHFHADHLRVLGNRSGHDPAALPAGISVCQGRAQEH